MKYLLFLSRFEKDKAVLEKKLEKLGIKVITDEGKSLVAEAESIESLDMQEIIGTAKLVTGWEQQKAFDFEGIARHSSSAMRDSGRKSYMIKTKFHDKTSFSSRNVYKHLNPALKRDGFIPDEKNAEVILNAEFKKEDNKTFYRVSYSFPAQQSAINVNYSSFAAVIESPSLPEEISDFLRICWIFRIPLFIVTKDRDFSRLLIKAKEITKGIDYEKMKLNVSEGMPEGYTLFGFSKLAKENESSLKKLLAENKQKIALVFGNDKFGLSQEARDRMQRMFRLTPELKKPLRASHALSYVLGIYTSMNIR